MDRRLHAVACSLLLAFALGLTACQPADTEEEAGPEADTLAADTVAEAPAEAGVVEVTAVDYAFQGPAEVPSGWTTFRLANEGEEPHFLILWKVPEGRSVEDYRNEVVPVFDAAYDSLEAGTMDQGAAGAMIGQNLPGWFGNVEAMGGPGLLAAGRTGETTVKLEPGSYVMECYVKSPEGEFHSSLGMLAGLTVTEDSTGMPEPEADVELTLTNADIAAASEGPIPAGEHTIAVRYEEHPEAGLGNDVHVARLDEGASLDEVSSWMNWMNLDGLLPPAPAEFVGGAQEVPVGSTSYFTVELEPGRYAWASEASAAERVVKEFTVE